jgi:uncharacterized membrane protein YkvA (DUF1232 family)
MAALLTERVWASVASDTPGRLRIRLGHAARRRVVLQRLAAELAPRHGILEVQPNSSTGSLLVRYDAQAVTPAHIKAALESNGIRLHGSRQRHPLFRLGGTVTRLPRYVGLAVRLLQDADLPTARRVVLICGMAYIALPIDLVPGFIPILGQLDDLVIFLLALRLAINSLPPAAATGYLERAGLPDTALDADVEVVRAVAVWMVRGAGRLLAGAVRLVVARR